MNIETAALIRYDVCHQSNQEVSLRNLRALYDDEGEKHGERILGGDRWNRFKIDGPLSDLDEDFVDFAESTTYVTFESRHLIDIVTAAELSGDQIEEIEGSDPDRSQYLISEVSGRLSNITEDIPTIAPTDFNRQPVRSTLNRRSLNPLPTTKANWILTC